VPRHVARLVTQLLAPLIVDYSGSSSTTPPKPRARVPQHVARLVTRLLAPLVVDYSGSSSTTPPTPHARVPRHVVRLVTRLLAPLVIDYSGLVVDYSSYAARPGASARRAARHVAPHAARR
jgi:hypothetical protein